MTVKSRNWDKFADTTSFVEEGFPFNEGFPKYPIGNTYHVITRGGVHLRHASVDLTTQYRAEGPQWRTYEGTLIYPHNVIAWKEEETQPTRPRPHF